jgi:hypothetical protein
MNNSFSASPSVFHLSKKNYAVVAVASERENGGNKAR